MKNKFYKISLCKICLRSSIGNQLYKRGLLILSVNPAVSRVNPVRSPAISKINDHARIMERKCNEDIAIKRFYRRAKRVSTHLCL